MRIRPKDSFYRTYFLQKYCLSIPIISTIVTVLLVSVLSIVYHNPNHLLRRSLLSSHRFRGETQCFCSRLKQTHRSLVLFSTLHEDLATPTPPSRITCPLKSVAAISCLPSAGNRPCPCGTGWSRVASLPSTNPTLGWARVWLPLCRNASPRDRSKWQGASCVGG